MTTALRHGGEWRANPAGLGEETTERLRIPTGVTLQLEVMASDQIRWEMTECNTGIGKKQVSGLMAQKGWRMITRELLGQASWKEPEKRCGQGESWLNQWFWKWNSICDDEIQGVAMGADCSSEGEDNWRKGERIRQQRQSKCSRLHGFIMRSMARLHFKRMVHRCLRKTFLVAKGCFFFFF